MYRDNSATLEDLHTTARAATEEGPQGSFASSEPSMMAPQLLLLLTLLQKLLAAWKDEVDDELEVGILEIAALDGLLKPRPMARITSFGPSLTGEGDLKEESQFSPLPSLMSLQKLFAVWNEEVEEDDGSDGSLFSATTTAEVSLASGRWGGTVPRRLGFSFKYEKEVC